MDLVDKYEKWLNNRAARLSRMFHLDVDETRQELVVQLIEFERPKIAWWKAKEKLAEQLTWNVDGEVWRNDDRNEISAIVEMVFHRLENDTQTTVFEMLLHGRSVDEICETVGIGQRQFRRIASKIRNIVWMDS